MTRAAVSTDADAGQAAMDAGAPGYAELSKRPLHVLVFLVPFVAISELGTLAYLTGEDGRVHETVSAYLGLTRFFELFGAFGLYLPGLALVTVLLVQHALRRDSWRVRPAVLGIMAVESCVLTAPVLVLGYALGPMAAAAVGGGAGGAGVLTGPWPERLTIAATAGLYEELLFRMVLIAFLHFLLVDVARAREGVGVAVAVVGSALAFALYHDLGTNGGGGFEPAKMAFYFAAGVYFALVYVWRGFGIAVGIHVLYDAIVLIAMGAGEGVPGAPGG